MGRLIDKDKLLAEYDRVHQGPPGGARKLIEDAPVVDRWIPVTERLPEIGELVVVCCMYGDGYMDQTIDSRAKDGNWWLNIAFDDPDPAECCKVIAWMPLPEPYMEGEQHETD